MHIQLEKAGFIGKPGEPCTLFKVKPKNSRLSLKSVQVQLRKAGFIGKPSEPCTLFKVKPKNSRLSLKSVQFNKA